MDTYMKGKFKVGRAYFIKFLDHTSGIKKTVMVEVIGWCLEDHKEYAVFSAWRLDEKDEDLVSNNHEPFSIVKSCIKKKSIIPDL